jgi:hypothetical protein
MYGIAARAGDESSTYVRRRFACDEAYHRPKPRPATIHRDFGVALSIAMDAGRAIVVGNG